MDINFKDDVTVILLLGVVFFVVFLLRLDVLHCMACLRNAYYLTGTSYVHLESLHTVGLLRLIMSTCEPVAKFIVPDWGI
jgi:hypothetical protein